MTFDVTAQVFRQQQHGWLNTHEAFSVCRQCRKPTIFVIRMSIRGRDVNDRILKQFSNDPSFFMKYEAALNPFFDVAAFINLRDHPSFDPPEHLPPDIETAFKEGAACHAIECYNAAACMFRLCLDHVSRGLLPKEGDASVPQPNANQRRNLAARLSWLFDQQKLPADLKKLAACVKDDGNHGAHVGNLMKEDADDLVDFTVAFLERLITEPKKIELAEARRQARRKP